MLTGHKGLEFINALLNYGRKKRYGDRLKKSPPKLVCDDDEALVYEMPEKVWEDPKVETDELAMVAEVRLFDDPYIPLMICFHYEDK